MKPFLWALLGAIAGALLVGTITAAVVELANASKADLKRAQDVANLAGLCVGAPLGYLYGRRRNSRP